MLKTIIEKEIRDIVGSTRFVVTFAVCALLVIASFYVGASQYKLARAQHEAAQAENLRQMEGITDWFSIQQHRIFLPPQPLATLVSGISNDIGRTTEVSGRGELNAYGSRYNEEPIFAVFRFLDLEFIFSIVLSLFAIMLGYDAICGEKERGTLRLTFANRVPRHTYILGKLIGSFAALGVSLALALALGCLLLPLMSIPMSPEAWIRLVVIIAAGLLYFGAFLTASLFVSSLTHRSSSAFMVMLVFWIMSVLIIPRASVLLSGRAVEVPSIDEIGTQKASFASQQWAESRAKMGSFKPENPIDEDNIEEMMDGFNRYMGELADEREEKLAEFNNRLNEQRRNRQAVQQAVAFNIARVSPTASLALATATLAETSLDLQRHYQQETMAYQVGYGAFMKEKTGVNHGGRMVVVKSMSEEGETPKPVDVNELPSFEYRAISLAQSLESAVVDIGLLVLYNLLFFAGSLVAFFRYDLR